MQIKCENLCKSYGDNSVFKNISFILEKNATLIVSGKNGSGKSTLAKCLSGVMDWDSGSYKIENISYDRKIHSSKIGFLNAEEGTYLAHLNVLENLKFSMSLEGSKDDLGLKLIESHFPIKKYYNKKVQTLSRGGQQLFFISRCFLDISKSIYILDEPTAHLDSDKIRLLENLITELQLKHGKIFVITTQEQNKDLISINKFQELTLIKD